MRNTSRSEDHMMLKPGTSRKVIRENIATLVKGGVPRGEAMLQAVRFSEETKKTPRKGKGALPRESPGGRA